MHNLFSDQLHPISVKMLKTNSTEQHQLYLFQNQICAYLRMLNDVLNTILISQTLIYKSNNFNSQRNLPIQSSVFWSEDGIRAFEQLLDTMLDGLDMETPYFKNIVISGGTKKVHNNNLFNYLLSTVEPKGYITTISTTIYYLQRKLSSSHKRICTSDKTKM